MSRSSPIVCWIAAGIVAAVPPVQAQTERSGGEAQKFMQQYQQLAAEKTSLKAQLADLQKQLDAAQAELATAKQERDALKARAGGAAAQLEQLAASKESAEKSLEQSRQRTNEIVAKFRETATALKDTEADRDRLQRQLADGAAAFDKCAEANAGLGRINGEVLDRYEHVGFFTRVNASDPFIRITRARIDNLVDEYRARAEELKVRKPGS